MEKMKPHAASRQEGHQTPVGAYHGYRDSPKKGLVTRPQIPGTDGTDGTTFGQDSGILWPGNVSSKSLQSILQAQHVGLKRRWLCAHVRI